MLQKHNLTSTKAMMQIERFNELYTHLPAVAQQEAFDFLSFLWRCYGGDKSLVGTNDKSVHSIRNNPAFGMWIDLQEDSRVILRQLRKQQWVRP